MLNVMVLDHKLEEFVLCSSRTESLTSEARLVTFFIIRCGLKVYLSVFQPLPMGKSPKYVILQLPEEPPSMNTFTGQKK